jgi:hypothetical protein
LYECESGYEYLADGSEDATTYTRIDDVEALFRSDWFTRVRVADRELVGHALEVAFPHDRRKVRKIAPRTFFRRHCVVQVELAPGPKLWLALADDRPKVTLLTGNIEGLGLVAREDPPSDLAPRALQYARFADEITTLSALREPVEADAQSFEELRTAAGILAPRVDALDDRHVVTRWVISGQELVRRTLTISASGAVRREDVRRG